MVKGNIFNSLNNGDNLFKNKNALHGSAESKFHKNWFKRNLLKQL